MNRRTFLGLLGAAPIAALVPWRRPPLAAYHATLGPVIDEFACYGSVVVNWGAGDATSVWLMRWRENGIVELLGETNRLLEALPWREA